MAKATLHVTRADNEVSAFLNGIQVYDKKTEGNPALNESVDLTEYLVPGINVIVVVGINWGGPATFSGSVTVGKASTKFHFQANKTPNGIAWTQSFVLPR